MRGSFSSAAEELYISQSAVSQHVSKLEAEVGVPLLQRTTAGPKPTPAGQALIAHADAVLCRLEEAERELTEIAGLEGGTLRLVSFPSATVTIVAHATAEYRSRFPNVKLRFSECDPEQSLPELRAGEHDLAVVYDFELNPFTPDRDIELTELVTETMTLALAADHPLAGRSSINLSELSDESWLAGPAPGSCRELTVRSCQQAGFDPKITFESNEYTVIKSMVAAGLGVTLLPELALANEDSGLAYVRVEPRAPVRRVWAATLAAGSRNPATEPMIELLAARAREIVATCAPRQVAAVA